MAKRSSANASSETSKIRAINLAIYLMSKSQPPRNGPQFH
jgi:hypothetical protein